MSIQPTDFVISQLTKKAEKYKKLSEFFEMLLNSSRNIESVTVKLRHNKENFRFSLAENEESIIVEKKLAQFFADVMDDFYQQQKSNEYQIQLFQADQQDKNRLN